jgi:hypothetical protein
MTAKSFRFLTVLTIAVALFSSACVRKVPVNRVLAVYEALSTNELIDRINAFADVKTFSGQATIVVRNYFTKEDEKADEFPSATALIRFQRPENTRMKVTFYSADVADMVTDGAQFKLAIYKRKPRFIYGSNLKEIDRMAADELKQADNPELKQAGGLVNMRPQHITDSFLIKPVADRSNVFREEVRQVEKDPASGKKNRLIERTYTIIYVLERKEGGQAELRRKFWFDRTQPTTPLVRQQTFDNGSGRLASDVSYSKWFTVPETNRQWPGVTIIDRRTDGYRLELELDKESVEINGNLPPTTFVLENKERLEEINLDAPHKMNVDSRKAPAEPARKPEALPPRQ